MSKFLTLHGDVVGVVGWTLTFEDGPRKLILDETTGAVVSVSHDRDDDGDDRR